MSEKNVQTEKVQKDLKNGAGLGQLTITLCGICAACALLLGLTNMVTAPIIEANAEAKKAAAIAAEVLPGFSGTLTQMYYIGSDSSINSVQKGSDGSFVVEVSPKSSFSGTLTLLVGIDANGSIAGISATKSGETEGIGSRALQPEYFQSQYVGKTGPVELGSDVEGITGASYTSGAVKDAVNSAYAALENLSDDASQVPDKPQEPMVSENIISMAKEGDGYVAVVDCGPDSFSRTLKIQVSIGTDKTVTAIEVVESGETQGVGSNALTDEYLQNYYGKTGPIEVDAYSGATFTSTAVNVGVNAALQAIDYPDQWPTAPVGSVGVTPETDGEGESSSVTMVGGTDGGYVVEVDCSADSFSKSLVLRVSISDDKTITGIEVVESGETQGVGSNALTEEHLGKYVGQSGTAQVDGVGGATFTSNAVNAGVNAALQAVDAASAEDSSVSVEQSGDGYVVTVDCGPDSFSKTLKIQVNIGADKKVTGVTVLESGETQGVGSNALTEEHLGKYVGQSGTVQVDGVGGATFTSNAVNAGVNAALQAVESQG